MERGKKLVDNLVIPNLNVCFQISSLMVETIGASSVHIPDKGWFLFGGNNLNTSQKLMDLDSNWEEGPEVQTVKQDEQCTVQVMVD